MYRNPGHVIVGMLCFALYCHGLLWICCHHQNITFQIWWTLRATTKKKTKLKETKSYIHRHLNKKPQTQPQMRLQQLETFSTYWNSSFFFLASLLHRTKYDTVKHRLMTTTTRNARNFACQQQQQRTKKKLEHPANICKIHTIIFCLAVCRSIV